MSDNRESTAKFLALVASGSRGDEPVLSPTSGDIAVVFHNVSELRPHPENVAIYGDQPDPDLTDLFGAIMAGDRTEQQLRRFGERATKEGRRILVATLRDYAETSGNFSLPNLLRRFEGFQANRPTPGKPKPAEAARPVLSDKERDYASIADVISRFDRPVGTADLGRFRRRWLEYPPRDASSAFRNRLEEVLAMMVRDGVLRATRTRTGATVYEPGPQFQQHRQRAEAWLPTRPLLCG
jgi:hypothetical protein